MTTDELLQRFAADRSETAFAELVRRHIDLVYSSALRQLNGDTGAAQDVTQAVFTALAGQAGKLSRHTSLAGWLYTTTRNLAAKARRTEHRRRAREQEAHAMNQVLQSTNPDPAWQEMRPLLDEAMHDLTAADREALLMRYFEHLPLAQIGERLGLAENAARMKVDRALTKLRGALAKRGVTSTALALAATLAERAVMAAPAGLAVQVSHVALVALAAQGGAGLIQFLATAKVKLLLAVGAAVVIASLLVLPTQLKKSPSPTGAAIIGAAPEASSGSSLAVTEASPTDDATAMRGARLATTSSKLMLKLVSAATGEPIPLAAIEFFATTRPRQPAPRRGSPESIIVPTITNATRLGVCEIPVPPGVHALRINTRTDGFVDTSFGWSVDDGETIPQEYTLRLPRATPIGGLVMDENGSPIAGAKVEFRVFAFSDNTNRIQFPHLTTSGFEVVSTDASGRWRIDRFSSEALDNIVLSMAYHAGFVTNAMGSTSGGTPFKMKQELLAKQYAITLTRAVALRGIVTDAEGRPVSGAEITVKAANNTSPTERTISIDDGTFAVTGCEAGKNQIVAEAPGMACTNFVVNLANNTSPLRITLSPGRLLRLQIINRDHEPLTNADIVLSFGAGRAHIQRWRTDDEGRFQWNSAPDQDLTFTISKSGYAGTEASIKPDGSEHIVTLSSLQQAGALTILGTVSDAATGLPIPNFSITTYPLHELSSGVTNFSSSPGRSFRDGHFRAVEPLGNDSARGWRFQFRADGYAAQTTRLVARNEGEAQFEIELPPATATTVSVLLPDGRPAAKADVAFKTAGNRLVLLPGGFARASRNTSDIVSTDEAGRFALPADDSILTVVAAHAAGFAETTLGTLAADQTIHLQPWGRLEGLFIVGGKTVAGRQLGLITNPARFG